MTKNKLFRFFSSECSTFCMKRFFTTLPMIMTVAWALAQYPVKQTVVLDDGSRITGTIISDSAGFLTVRLTKPAIIIINKEKIVSSGKPGKPEIPVTDYHGFNIKFSAGLLGGNSETGRVNSFIFHAATGYQFRNGLSAGAGTGFEDVNATLIPVYADVRYHPLKTRVSPFGWVKLGYAIPVSDYRADIINYQGFVPGKTYGGLLFSTGVGIALWSWRGNAVTIGAGYRTQRIRIIQEPSYRYDIRVREVISDFRRFEVQFGLIFR